jgi:hypothetical protein
MTLATGEFSRRFLIHVLPAGFHRIRYYGLLASGKRAENVARARELLLTPPPVIPIDAITAIFVQIASASPSSCPRLSRASTSCFLARAAKKDVDGRDKPGHDVERRC